MISTEAWKILIPDQKEGILFEHADTLEMARILRLVCGPFSCLI